MATWWEERAALVTDAIAMVSAQSRCTPAEALTLLRRRAEVTDADLEAVAAAVVDSGTRLSHRDLGPSPTTNPSDEPAASSRVSVT